MEGNNPDRNDYNKVVDELSIRTIEVASLQQYKYMFKIYEHLLHVDHPLTPRFNSGMWLVDFSNIDNISDSKFYPTLPQAIEGVVHFMGFDSVTDPDTW